MGDKKLEAADYSCEIDNELIQLIALGELLYKLEDPAETREGFFCGIGLLIQSGADRIKEMVGATYDDCYQRGADSTTIER